MLTEKAKQQIQLDVAIKANNKSKDREETFLKTRRSTCAQLSGSL